MGMTTIKVVTPDSALDELFALIGGPPGPGTAPPPD
jgi:hypothetical protein